MIYCFQKTCQLFPLDTVKLLRIVAIEEIKNRNLQYLIESLISRVENVTSIYQVKTINESGLLKKMEKIIR